MLTLVLYLPSKLDANGMTGSAWLDFWRPFFLSPGAAATAALIAAIIAYRAARGAQRRADALAVQEHWWTATMWAGEQALSEDPHAQATGYKALTAIQRSEGWNIDAYQAEFIKSLSSGPLDAFEVPDTASAQSRDDASNVPEQEA